MKAGVAMRYACPNAAMLDAFHQGEWTRAYQFFGAHPENQNGQLIWHFALWAPNAETVAITGDFNGWDYVSHPMHETGNGIWQAQLPQALFNNNLITYKYAVKGRNGAFCLKADPYAFCAELRPNTASKLYDLDGYAWHDDIYMAQRSAFRPYESPINVYEMHLGSWRRHADNGFYSYDEIGDELIRYLTEMGYTHVEFLPVMEHPLDDSWGYQVTGQFAATARYGEPKALMRLIDRLHQAGIGVILDWVPAHFPKDESALRRFDGTPLYEHPDPRRGDMPRWGTHLYDLSKGEVRSFLLSSATFWLEYYHADGLRVDAVSAMLYYDHEREKGQWLPNAYGGRENLDAIHFFRCLNDEVRKQQPGVMVIAEESTTYPMVTKPTYLGGLGFTFKWNMGWMNDILSYISLESMNRRNHHEKLTFPMMYAFTEHFMLPLSHDEVVHGKRSLIERNPGDLWQKFAGLRALYGYMFAHPGKKLMFMGGEFGQFIEWRFGAQLDWFLLDYMRHPELMHLAKTLNHLYRNTPALYQLDDGWDGFKWLTVNDKQNAVIAFMRTDAHGRSIVVVCNFTPAFHPVYRIGLPMMGRLTELMNTDQAQFGGSDQCNAYTLDIMPSVFNDMPCSVDICVPPLATVYFTVETPLS